jgi:hypothetical protein
MPDLLLIGLLFGLLIRLLIGLLNSLMVTAGCCFAGECHFYLLLDVDRERKVFAGFASSMSLCFLCHFDFMCHLVSIDC